MPIFHIYERAYLYIIIYTHNKRLHKHTYAVKHKMTVPEAATLVRNERSYTIPASRLFSRGRHCPKGCVRYSVAF